MKRGFPSLTDEPLNNHVIVALGRAVTGHKISTSVPITVVMFPPIAILTCFSPLTAMMFSSGLVIVGALPSNKE